MDCSPPGSSVHGISQARIYIPGQEEPGASVLVRGGTRILEQASARSWALPGDFKATVNFGDVIGGLTRLSCALLQQKATEQNPQRGKALGVMSGKSRAGFQEPLQWEHSGSIYFLQQPVVTRQQGLVELRLGVEHN